jgi:hypothetical protein
MRPSSATSAPTVRQREIRAVNPVAERLGPRFGPMVVFAAATGLRPSELFAIEHGDLDRAAGVVQVWRALAHERAVDAGWTPARNPAKPHGGTVSRPRERVSRRAKDARWTSKLRQVATGRAEGAD